MVDTGSRHTWLPDRALRSAGVTVAKKGIPFVMPSGATITRDVGYAYLRSGDFETVDEVVFALPTDLHLLGARTLQGFAARMDPRAKRLVAAEPRTVVAARRLTQRSSAKSEGRNGRRVGAGTMTMRQEDYVKGLANKRGCTPKEAVAWAISTQRASAWPELTAKEASRVIDWLRSRRSARRMRGSGSRFGRLWTGR